MATANRRLARSGGALALVLAFLLLFASLSLAAQAKNVILLIPDGCSSEQYTLARWSKGQPLAFDSILTGAVRTFIADSVVADSAPAATAYATGVRTSDKFISVGPRAAGRLAILPAPAEGLPYRPLATVLEGAKLQGKAVGLVATARVSHATPAAFAAHTPERDQELAIMTQLVHHDLDVVLGGGAALLLPEAQGGKRTDGADLRAVLQKRGYQLAANREELARVKAGKLYGLFAPGHLEPDIDRATFAPGQPSLAEMTQKALAILSQSPKGFFLMVEGSQVDWACHANDPAHLLSELLAYDRAVQVALDFAKKDGQTLLIAVSDHNTGGMSIGNRTTDKTYSQMKLTGVAPAKQSVLLTPLKDMTLTAAGIWRKLGPEPSPERLKTLVKEHWSLELGDDEIEQILQRAANYRETPFYGLAEVVSARHTVVGWTTHGHAGGDVPLFAYGPGKPSGLLEAPQVARAMARAMGIDLAQATRRLFAEADSALPGAKRTLDRSDPRDPVVVIEHRGKTARLPVNGNLLELDGRRHKLEGVVLHSEATGKTYLPRQAVRLIAGRK